MHIRTQTLELDKLIRIDKETHSNLRLLKRKLKKSMAQIIKDLTIKEKEKYENTNSTNTNSRKER